MTVLLLHIAALFLLLLCSAFFSSAEVAFFSLNPLEISRIGVKNPFAAQRINHALERPTTLLSAILIGNTLVNVCTSVVGFSMVEGLGGAYSEQVAIPLVTLLLLIFGEIGPKRVAIHHNLHMSLLYAPAVLVVIKVTAPLRMLLEHITTSLNQFFKATPSALSEDEFETLVELSQESGVLDEDEGAMVRSIMRLVELKASDIMTPRVDIIGIDLNESAARADRIICQSRVPRLILYRDHLDAVEGILDVRTYLLADRPSIRQAWLTPFYVPETARLNTMLKQFQTNGRRLAIVVDEYGGTAGIVTRGDVLEEIAGDMAMEFERHESEISRIGPHRWLIDGQTSLEDINAELHLQLDADGVDRLSGWITVQAHHLPQVGESVSAQGCCATVKQMYRHRIIRAEITVEQAV